MIVVSSFEITESGRRSQPWGATEGHEYKAGKYYNFREQPELITTHLEDFVDHADQMSVQNFYEFIRWINGPESALESTDCMLSGEPKGVPSAALFRCTHGITGRFEFFIRQIEMNANKEAIRWVYDKLSIYLQIERPDFRKGSFRISPLITDYITPDGNKLTGHRFCIYFQAYGNGIHDTWLSLETMFDSLAKTTKRLNTEIISGQAVPL
ncbi:hypothetical protein [Klebsiella pneumoniae]|uniref:hypothetical protein n=1 Tax=Klebsiella pneumoniae TaxID=573 RepID=UPI002118845D|nr:hypothetical protein [Klebsiella pneumoniae]